MIEGVYEMRIINDPASNEYRGTIILRGGHYYYTNIYRETSYGTYRLDGIRYTSIGHHWRLQEFDGGLWREMKFWAAWSTEGEWLPKKKQIHAFSFPSHDPNLKVELLATQLQVLGEA